MSRPILTLDFDGVLHSYSSGWKGARNIPDPPVPGALEFVATALRHFDLHILSSRSHQWLGRRAMKEWLKFHMVLLAENGYDRTPTWLRDIISETAFADPWRDEARFAIDKLVARIKFPLFKPPSMVTIDDRALTFTGVFPSVTEIQQFKPWNKKRASK